MFESKHRLTANKGPEPKSQTDEDKLKIINTMLKENQEEQNIHNKFFSFENDYQQYLDHISSNKQEMTVID